MKVTIRYIDSLTGEATTIDTRLNMVSPSALIDAFRAEDECNDPEAGAGEYWMAAFVPLSKFPGPQPLAGFVIRCQPPTHLTPSHTGGLDDYLIVGTITGAQQ